MDAAIFNGMSEDMAADVVAGFALAVVKGLKDYYLVRAFGHGWGFAFGLMFLGPVFMLILGFGSSEYIGNTTA